MDLCFSTVTSEELMNRPQPEVEKHDEKEASALHKYEDCECTRTQAFTPLGK